MPALVDMTGKRYGRLEVLKRGENVGDRVGWICRCDCGTVKTISGDMLRKGLVISCGCYRKEISTQRATKHSQCGSRLYMTYHNMKKRCYNPNSDHYKWYGAENKHICDEWMGEKGFENFSDWALKNGYSEELTIDRKDNNKGYSPDNCRWVTPKQNCRNKRNNHYVVISGEKKTLAEWCECFGVDERLVRSRISCGWDEKRALTTPKLRERRS